MSLDIAIDEALKRGASPVMISRTLGVSMAAIEKRREVYQMRLAQMRQGRRTQEEQRKAKLRQLIREVYGEFREPPEDLMRDRDRDAMARWCALPITYANDPRSYRDGAIRVVLRLSATGGRTLGGVADYSSREAA